MGTERPAVTSHGEKILVNTGNTRTLETDRQRRIAGGVAVTVPSCWYLWPSSHADSGHHDAHDEHEEGEGVLGGEDNSDGDSVVPKAAAEALPEGVEKAVPDSVHNTSGKGGDSEDTAGGEDNSGGDSVVPKPVAEALPEGAEKAVPDSVHNTSGSEGSDDSENQKDDEAGDMGQGKEESSHAAKGDPKARNSTEQKQTAKASDKASGSQGEGQDAGSVTPTEVAEPKEGGSQSGQGKGHMKADSDGTGDNRKREPDNKGGFKKRVDSGLGKGLGATDQQFDDDGSETVSHSEAFGKGVTDMLIRYRPHKRSRQSRTTRATSLASSLA